MSTSMLKSPWRPNVLLRIAANAENSDRAAPPSAAFEMAAESNRPCLLNHFA
jgi:hypothetical protein